jgi:hypothetical protein
LSNSTASTVSSARLARRLLERCQELNQEINALEWELRDLVRVLAPSLMAIPGCGVLSAAVILGESAGVHRFRDKYAYARFTGTAPVRSGPAPQSNRSVNCALHMIAVTQTRGIGPGRAYVGKQLESGRGPRRCDSYAAECPTSSSPQSDPCRPKSRQSTSERHDTDQSLAA